MIFLAVASNQRRLHTQKQGLCWEKESWIPDKWSTLQSYVHYRLISLWLERLMPVYRCKDNYHWAKEELLSIEWSDSNSLSFLFVFRLIPTAAYLNTGIILMNQGRLDEAKRTFLTCADIPDENLKDPHAHKSSVTSCLYNLGKLLHEQGHQEVMTDCRSRMLRKYLRQ